METAEVELMNLLVYGATGSQGHPVARKLTKDGHQVRVLTRNSSRAKELHNLGAEIVQGDLASKTSLFEASTGVEGVFLHVPFFTDSPADGLRYGKNAIDAAREADVQLIVWNASGEIPAQRSGNPGFDVRLQMLEHLQNSGISYVVLQPTTYMDYMENFYVLGPMKSLSRTMCSLIRHRSSSSRVTL